MKEEYPIKVSVRKAGGNASKSALRGSINIPKDVLKDMDITKDDNCIILIYDPKKKEIRIKKENSDKE